MKVVVLLLCACGAVFGADRSIVVNWPDLATHVKGAKFSTVLVDGTRVDGRAIAVEADGLAAEVNHQRKVLPRASLSSITLHKAGKKWKIMCPIFGFIGGGYLGLGVGINKGGWEGGGVGLLSGIAVGTTAGVIGGVYADRYDVAITIAK